MQNSLWNTVFENTELIQEKWIEHFFCEINKVFNLNNKDKKKIWKAYNYCKEKFSNKYRNNWEKYFEHLEQVSLISIEIFEKELNKIKKNKILHRTLVDRIIIALLHDIIEDTNVDFNEIKDLFWINIAIAVQALSKNKINIKENSDKILLKSSWILDKNWEIKKDVKLKIKKWELSYIEEIWLDIFNKYRHERNNEYFSRFESFESMYKYIKSISKNLNNEELKRITKNVLNIKYADRIHNLRTQWDEKNISKVYRKLVETEHYFLNSSEKNNIKAFSLLTKELIILGKKINNELKERKKRKKIFNIIKKLRLKFNWILTLF